MKFVTAAVLLVCALSAGGNRAPATFDSSPVAHVRQSFLKAYNAKDAAAVAALYAEDATLVSPASTHRGRAAIQEWVQRALDEGSRLESIEAAQEKSSGTLAYSTGRSKRVVSNEVHLGQYLLVIERIGSEWKIVQHFSVNAN